MRFVIFYLEGAALSGAQELGTRRRVSLQMIAAGSKSAKMDWYASNWSAQESGTRQRVSLQMIAADNKSAKMDWHARARKNADG